MFGGLRKTINKLDTENVSDYGIAVGSMYTLNLYYYNYDTTGKESENPYFKAMKNANKINAILYKNNISVKDLSSQLSSLQDQKGYSTHYNLTWCIQKEKLGNRGEEILALTLVDSENGAEMAKCLKSE